MKARVESASAGLERYVQDWLDLSKVQAECRDLLVAALVEQVQQVEGRMVAVEVALAELTLAVNELSRRGMRPGTWVGRLIWRLLGVHYGSDAADGGDGSESGGDGDDHGECG